MSKILNQNIMGDLDIRWIQRLENYSKALRKLEEAVNLIPSVSDLATIDLLKDGLIQRFEFTQDLSWKVMKDYLEYQGETNISGSRDAFRKSLAAGLIDNPLWLDTIKIRNLTSHTYDEEITSSVYNSIIRTYLPLLIQFELKMLKIKEHEDL